MIQAQTQKADYWGANFTISDADIEQIYNYFLESEKPQNTQTLTEVVVAHRLKEEARQTEKLIANRTIYQPQNSYAVGDELVFPAFGFAQGDVSTVREGYNPEIGKFQVLKVSINGKEREFAGEFDGNHALNRDDQGDISNMIDTDPAPIIARYGKQIEATLTETLEEKQDFVKLGRDWFVKSLLLDINIGHMHLADAILDMSGGGPLPTDEMIPHLDLDPAVDISVQRFSLNHALREDKRFDEVAPIGEIAWYLRRMEPEPVQTTPERLVYKPIHYDRALLSPQLIALEHDLDDEWSNLDPVSAAHPVTLALTYPHRWAGTLPLSSRVRPIFPESNASRQLVFLIDEESGDELQAWIVREGRYIYGLKEWFEEREFPVGGFIHLAPGPEPGKVLLNYDKRKPQREWIRLATVSDNRLQFELSRRRIGCGFDDLMVVGTDVVAAVDAVWKRAESHQRSIADLLAEVVPTLASLNPQNSVDAKTIYSAIQMLKRLPPGPLFAELVRNPAFQMVGDHYWQFDRERWQANN